MAARNTPKRPRRSVATVRRHGVQAILDALQRGDHVRYNVVVTGEEGEQYIILGSSVNIVKQTRMVEALNDVGVNAGLTADILTREYVEVDPKMMRQVVDMIHSRAISKEA